MLISPPGIEFIEPFRSSLRKPFPIGANFPIGLGYLAAVLKRQSFDVSILDAFFDNISIDQIIYQLKEYQPAIVGISSLTHNLKSAIILAKAIKQHCRDIKVIFGGPHASYDYENLLNLNCIDYIVLGEGELTFLELCQKIECNEFPEETKSIAFRDKKGGIKKTGLRPLIEDLDILPFPAREIVDFEKYINNYSPFVKGVDILSSRGCTNRCLFCNPSNFFGKWRPRSPENVIMEIKSLINRYPVIENIAFTDDNFSKDKQRIMKLCNLLIENKLHKYRWTCLSRIDQLDEETIWIMKSAGCKAIYLGIESGSAQILKNINKCISLEQVRTIIKLISVAKIEARGFFIIGHPGETAETISLTKKFAGELKLAVRTFFIAQIFPGTGLEKLQPVKNWAGYIYEPEINNPSIFTHPCIPAFIPEGFTRESLKKICGDINRQFAVTHFFKRYRLILKKLITQPRAVLNYILDTIKFCLKIIN